MAKKSTKATNKEKENIAFDLYMNTDLSQKEICELVNWTEKTFSTHKKEGDWEVLKGAQTVTAQKIIVNIYKQIYELSQSTSAIDADKMLKLSKTAKDLQKEATISHFIMVFKDFTTHMFGVDQELAKTINLHQMNFIKTKIAQ